jgi:hypothetical protein
MTASNLKNGLLQHNALTSHSQADYLIDIITGDTALSSAGFPYISDRSFRIFSQQVCHLFGDGQAILDWLETLQSELTSFEALTPEDAESIQRAVKVVQTVVFTAAVTAPPDLWILRQVLGIHKQLGTLEYLLNGHAIVPEEYAERHHLDCGRLRSDLHLLHARGYLDKGDGDFWGPNRESVIDVLSEVEPLQEQFRIHWVPKLVTWFNGEDSSDETKSLIQNWLTFDVSHKPTAFWVASLHQVEVGYRILPLTLALRVLNLTSSLTQGESLDTHVANLLPEMTSLYEQAGFVDDGVVTQLGARVFQRGPGPFGIIGAYHPYLTNLEALLRGDRDIETWVRRGENVAASQDANSKTFRAANDHLDAFCQQFEWKYNLFIEHAVGQGEAIRQRFERDGESHIRYFGADLEPKAIEQAQVQQTDCILPQNLEFICPADIGEPSKVTEYFSEQNLLGQPTVMMVGNGFHEIRNQTNEKMINVFRAYQDASFVLIFTEESALNDEALRHTAWNTYHAGFRYVHELSGQGLRPARGTGQRTDKWSWRRCATLGGYVVLDEFSYRTRKIYPFPRTKDRNPAISETFFCVPYSLAIQLGIEVEE